VTAVIARGTSACIIDDMNVSHPLAPSFALMRLPDDGGGRPVGTRTDEPPAPWKVSCAWHESEQGPRVTHTICPTCLERMMQSSARARRGRAIGP